MYKQRVERFIKVLNHCQRLGIYVSDAAQAEVTLALPYSESLVGNPDSGVIHGGPITTLMDTACGSSVIIALPELELCPTLDLRVDYMRSAVAGETIYGHAVCYKITKNVVFTRCVTYEKTPEDPVAHCVGTFMRLGTENTPATFRDYLLADETGVN